MKPVWTTLFCDAAEGIQKLLLSKGIDAAVRQSNSIPCYWGIFVWEQQYDTARELINRHYTKY